MIFNYKFFIWIFYPLNFIFRISIYPKYINKEYFNEQNDTKYIYVLPKISLIDIFILKKAHKKIYKNNKNFPDLLFLANKKDNISKKEYFRSKIKKLIDIKDSEKILFLPVSIFWSRSATYNNILQKLLMLLLHRGEVNVFFGKSFPFNPPIIDDKKNKFTIEHTYILQLRRMLKIEFAKEKTAVFGSTVYNQKKIKRWILGVKSSRDLIADNDFPKIIKKKIIGYINEISAKYNYFTIRSLEIIFDFFWNKIFSGIIVSNFDSVARIAKDGQIIWVPNHRSHLDYLLLSYVLFKRGLVPPHVAAGINLNFWPIGSLLRLCGAFFIRRSFAGNKIYAHTFAEYVNFLLQNSFPIEFFAEGGRSRTGKLLAPKLGMLNICLQSIFLRKASDTYFIPVYFGYDKVMEENSYAKELLGAKKKKENFLQFFHVILKIFRTYGKVNVSFGEPIRIADAWEKYYPAQQFGAIAQSAVEYRENKNNDFVKNLAINIHQKINSAAIISNSALLATVLLTHKFSSIEIDELKFNLLLLNYLSNKLGLLLKWRIGSNTLVPNIFEYLLAKIEHKNELIQKNIEDIAFEYCKIGEKWKFIHAKNNHINAKVYQINDEKKLNLFWYRGTSFHIFAIFGIISYFLVNLPKSVNIQELINKTAEVRNFWHSELYWDNSSSTDDIVHAVLNIFAELCILHIQNNIINIKNGQILYLCKNLIDIERNLYKLQIQAAQELCLQQESFSKDELLQKTLMLHTQALSKHLITQENCFSKIFFHNIFAAYQNFEIYLSIKNINFIVNINKLSNLKEFLEL